MVEVIEAATIDTSDRHTYVGASEVSVLFGENPWKSRWQLWLEKTGKAEAPDLSSNEKVFWGSYLEPALAAGVAEQTGWKLRNVRRLIRHRDLPVLASHPDYEIVSHDDGPGVAELKTVGRYFWQEHWTDGPPLNYQLQLQTQLACMGREWGVIAALVGGQKLEIYRYDAHPRIQKAILSEVEKFWSQVETLEEPEPDWKADRQMLASIHGVEPGLVYELDDEADEWIVQYEAAKLLEKQAKQKKDEAMAHLAAMVEGAEVAHTPAGGRIKRTHIPEKEISFTRKESYRMTVTAPKGKKV